VFSYTYELPFGRGKRFLSGAAVDKLIGGWQVNGITTFSTGQYKTPTLPQDWQFLGAFSSSRPNKIGSAYPSHQTYTNWLEINSYVFPGCPHGVFDPTPQNCPDAIRLQGNAARSSIEMPGISNWDIGLMK